MSGVFTLGGTDTASSQQHSESTVAAAIKEREKMNESRIIR